MKSEAEIRALDEVLYALENLIVRVNQRFEPNGGLWLPEAIEKAEAALAKARPLAAQPAPNTEESCGTAQAAGISMGEVGPLTAKGVLPLGGLIPEWELLTPTSRAKIEKWFDLACQSLQKTLDGPFDAQPAEVGTSGTIRLPTESTLGERLGFVKGCEGYKCVCCESTPTPRHLRLGWMYTPLCESCIAKILSSAAPATVDEKLVPPIPKCPQCGDEATYRTPDGTFWDGNAHYWRLPVQFLSASVDKEKVKELATAANVFGARVKERDPSAFDSEWGTDFAEARDRLAAALVTCGFKFAALLPDEGKP